MFLIKSCITYYDIGVKCQIHLNFEYVGSKITRFIGEIVKKQKHQKQQKQLDEIEVDEFPVLRVSLLANDVLPMRAGGGDVVADTDAGDNVVVVSMASIVGGGGGGCEDTENIPITAQVQDLMQKITALESENYRLRVELAAERYIKRSARLSRFLPVYQEYSFRDEPDVDDDGGDYYYE